MALKITIRVISNQRAERLAWARLPREVAQQAELFPRSAVLAFTQDEAEVGTQLYRQWGRARTREMDIAIAACALTHRARLWTLKPADFKDIPGLQLVI